MQYNLRPLQKEDPPSRSVLLKPFPRMYFEYFVREADYCLFAETRSGVVGPVRVRILPAL